MKRLLLAFLLSPAIPAWASEHQPTSRKITAQRKDIAPIPPAVSKESITTVFNLAREINAKKEGIARNIKLTDGTTDNGIMMGKLQPIVDGFLSEYAIDQLVDFLKAANYLDIQPTEILAAATRILVEKVGEKGKSELITKLIEKQSKNKNKFESMPYHELMVAYCTEIIGLNKNIFGDYIAHYALLDQAKNKRISELSVADLIHNKNLLVINNNILNLDNKGLTSLDGLDAKHINGLTHLQYLQLSENKLTALPSDIFKGTSLQWLNLSYNQLTTLQPGAFNSLTHLQELYLDKNQLTTLTSDIFKGLTHLQELDLDQNQLTTLNPGVFNGLTNLQRLSFAYNQLTALQPGVFNGLTNLKKLWLNGNQLTDLKQGVFNDLTNLTILSFNGNQLRALQPGVFNGPTNLQYLSLDKSLVGDKNAFKETHFPNNQTIEINLR